MTIELEARITTAEPLATILAHAERHVVTVPHSAFSVDGHGDLAIGPFPVPRLPGHLDQTREFKEAFSAWPHEWVFVSSGARAKIGLMVGYRARIDEVELGSYQPIEADQRESDATAGYCVQVNCGFLRTRESFCLACLIICAVAERNRSVIFDDAENLLNRGRFVEPGALAELFTRHANAVSFTAFADAFCDDLGFNSWR